METIAEDKRLIEKELIALKIKESDRSLEMEAIKDKVVSLEEKETA